MTCVKVRSTTRSVERVAGDVDGMLEIAARDSTGVPTLDGGRAVGSIKCMAWIEHGCAHVTVNREKDISWRFHYAVWNVPWSSLE